MTGKQLVQRETEASAARVAQLLEALETVVEPYDRGVQISIAEVPAVILVERERRPGVRRDLANTHEKAFHLAGLEVSGNLSERPVLLTRSVVLIVRDRLQERQNLGAAATSTSGAGGLRDGAEAGGLTAS